MFNNYQLNLILSLYKGNLNAVSWYLIWSPSPHIVPQTPPGMVDKDLINICLIYGNISSSFYLLANNSRQVTDLLYYLSGHFLPFFFKSLKENWRFWSCSFICLYIYYCNKKRHKVLLAKNSIERQGGLMGWPTIEHIFQKIFFNSILPLDSYF